MKRAVNEFGVAHHFIVEEWDLFIVGDQVIPGSVLDGTN